MKRVKGWGLIAGVIFSFAGIPVVLYAQSSVSGRVIFDGTPPAVEKVEVKSDMAVCGKEKEVRKILLGVDQGVANAVVRVIGAKGPMPSKDGSLDQVNCEFVPHVQVIPAEAKLKITSSDSVLHNSHGFYEDNSTAFNIAVPIVGMEVSHKMDKPGVVRLRCDAGHTWMSGYIFVTEEPFYALTDADGNFNIDGIPAGSYEIEVWQEWLGKIRQPVTVKEGAAEKVEIHLKSA